MKWGEFLIGEEYHGCPCMELMVVEMFVKVIYVFGGTGGSISDSINCHCNRQFSGS